MNEKANQLAHYLIGLGVKADVPVGLYIERSLEMVIALLAILKAGGAYVPLDPLFPNDRLQFIADEILTPILITHQIEDKPLFHRKKIICFVKDQKIIGQQKTTNPQVSIHTESLAYIIFTSGSTGKPKGVQIKHKALTNFLNSMKKTPGLSPEDRLLAVTTISFDIAALDAGRIPPDEGLHFIKENSKVNDFISIGFGSEIEIDDTMQIFEKYFSN